MPLIGILCLLILVGILLAVLGIDRRTVFLVLLIGFLFWFLAALGLFGTPYWRLWP